MRHVTKRAPVVIIFIDRQSSKMTQPGQMVVRQNNWRAGVLCAK